jgi:hypothetical protein
METYFNLEGVECVIIHNEDGSVWSGYKWAYDEEQAKAALSTPNV